MMIRLLVLIYINFCLRGDGGRGKGETGRKEGRGQGKKEERRGEERKKGKTLRMGVQELVFLFKKCLGFSQEKFEA